MYFHHQQEHDWVGPSSLSHLSPTFPGEEQVWVIRGRWLLGCSSWGQAYQPSSQVPFVTVRHLAFQVHLSIIIFLLRMLLLVCVYSRRADSQSVGWFWILDLPAEKPLWGVKRAPVSVRWLGTVSLGPSWVRLPVSKKAYFKRCHSLSDGGGFQLHLVLNNSRVHTVLS